MIKKKGENSALLFIIIVQYLHFCLIIKCKNDTLNP